MVNLTINSIPVTVPEGTTILDAAASVDIEIPSLCYLKELNEISACRVCCVEVEGEGKLVPSCNNVVREGMVIRTNSPRALEARRVNMELILSQHDNKCATCIHQVHALHSGMRQGAVAVRLGYQRLWCAHHH